MKSSDIEAALVADSAAEFAYRPAKSVSEYSPVYIRGVNRSVRGVWSFGEVKRLHHDWRPERGTFKPAEIISAAEADAIVVAAKRRRDERHARLDAMERVAGRVRLLGAPATVSEDGIIVSATWLDAVLDACESFLGTCGDVDPAAFSWCEMAAATGVRHIRRLTSSGRKLGGGADTQALCGAPAAWDLNGDITAEQLSRHPAYGWPCPACAKVLLEAMG